MNARGRSGVQRGGEKRRARNEDDDAVVVTVTVAVTAFVPSRVTWGVTEQVEFEGAPVHVSDTEPLNPPAGVIATLYLAD